MLQNFIVDYLRHRISSNTRHGTHSPFVYKLADEVVYRQSHDPVFVEIENLRKQLLVDERLITITDLGAGSLINKNKQKKVKQIAKNALKRPKLAQLIYRLVREQQPKSIIELGTCLGITTAYLSNTNSSVKTITIEGCPNTAKVAKENFEILGLKNVELLVGNFDDKFPEVIQQLDQLDVVYIDGNHTKEATLNYFNQCLERIHENSLLIFDDIYWSEGMKEAWAEIKSHPSVTVTVDLFWIGLVYFRKGQAKENFKLKV